MTSVYDEPFDQGPSTRVRVALWFAILLGGEILTWVVYFKADPYFVLCVPLFPSALLYPLVVRLHAIVPDNIIGFFGQGSVLISNGFYLGHFIFTLITPSKRTFRILMMILLVAVLLNMFGLHMLLNEGKM